MQVRNIVMAAGVVMILVGMTGFLSDPILGVFEVNAMHNWVHIVTGAIAIIASITGEAASRGFSKLFGAIYGLIGLWGLATSASLILGMEVNPADHVLHLLLGAAFLALGFAPHKVTGTIDRMRPAAHH